MSGDLRRLERSVPPSSEAKSLYIERPFIGQLLQRRRTLKS